MPPEKTPLRYTFGNHMHWVDMQWLWGYHVMPGSTADMLRFAEAAQAKGNVNFDGVGYEKLAAEAPEALAALRQVVQQGRIEPVGGSYAQPYGLFHGGESNIRHRVYGARAVRRLLGVWPKTFWEEEFDFFPQLPQMLKGCGFEFASLYFQWTWHTPEVPRETVPAVLWEGQDGSRLLTATRNALNLHQWPEDMQILFDQLAAGEHPVESVGDVPPLILQWVELMPSPDWMCRSEVLLPKLLELLRDPRFDIQPCTLGEYLADVRDAGAPIQVRKYSMDDVWHGMSVGKNGDRMRQESRRLESELLAAESLATVLGCFGRPYPRWDVYPVWELEEGWRQLLVAQHHDNDECEALCGHVAVACHKYVEGLLPTDYLLAHIAERTGIPQGSLAANALGWPVPDPESGALIPPMGYAPTQAPTQWIREGAVLKEATLRQNLGEWTVHLDQTIGQVSFEHPTFPEGCFRTTPRVSYQKHGEQVVCERIVQVMHADEYLAIHLQSQGDSAEVCLFLEKGPLGALRIVVSVTSQTEEEAGTVHHPERDPDPGMNAGVRIEFCPAFEIGALIADSPYAVHEVHPNGSWPKKYPKGDWMTSEQWFENVEKPFHSTSLVDWVGEDGAGLMIVHDSSQQWFRTEEGIANLLTMCDPWDNGLFNPFTSKTFHLVPHSLWSNRDRWKTAQTLLNPPIQREPSTWARAALKPEVDMPPTFGGLDLIADHSLVTAFYRESEDAGKHVEGYAGAGMSYPAIVRIVEFDGMGEVATLKLPGEVAAVFKTNLLGGEPQPLAMHATDSPGYSPPGWEWTAIEVPLRPFEIATLYVDLVMARKQTRDLDAKREVWATVHRVE